MSDHAEFDRGRACGITEVIDSLNANPALFGMERASTGRQPEAPAPEPFRCTACGRPYKPPVHPAAMAAGAYYQWVDANYGKCECGNNTFAGTIGGASTEAPAVTNEQIDSLMDDADNYAQTAVECQSRWEAYTERECLRANLVSAFEAPVVRDSEGPREEPQSTAESLESERAKFERWATALTGAQPLQEKT